MLCPLLQLPSVPLLGRYNQEEYDIKPILRHGNYEGPLPSALVAALSRLEPIKICEFFEVEYDCERTEGTLNLLFHSTVFYNALDLKVLSTVVKAAVFPSDECFSKYSLVSSNDTSWLCSSPLDLMSKNCDCEVTIHPRDDDVCCSPDNAKVGLKALFPVVEFFTVVLVPYQGKFVRRVVCRHVVRFRHSSLHTIPPEEARQFLWERVSVTDLDYWCLDITADLEGLRNFIMWFIWLVDGCPTHEARYGEIILTSLSRTVDSTLEISIELSRRRYQALLIERLCHWHGLFYSEFHL